MFPGGHAWEQDVLLTNQKEQDSSCRQTLFTSKLGKTLVAAGAAVGTDQQSQPAGKGGLTHMCMPHTYTCPLHTYASQNSIPEYALLPLHMNMSSHVSDLRAACPRERCPPHATLRPLPQESLLCPPFTLAHRHVLTNGINSGDATALLAA